MKTFLCIGLSIIAILSACTPGPLLEATATSEPLTMTATLPPPTPTPLPTLPPDQAKARVIELLKSNNGCKLPCFWGITPGRSSWDDAKSFLEAFSSRAEENDLTNSRFLRSIYFALNDQTFNLRLTTDKNIVEEILAINFDSPSYYLAEFLANNGAPDQVWVLTYRQHADDGTEADVIPSFLIYLFYKDAQMIVAYGHGQGTVKGDQITGCIDGSPSLYISTPDKSLTFLELADQGPYYEPGDPFLEISDASQGKLNAKKFFETFKNPSVEACFQTPKELWPTH